MTGHPDGHWTAQQARNLVHGPRRACRSARRLPAAPGRARRTTHPRARADNKRLRQALAEALGQRRVVGPDPARHDTPVPPKIDNYRTVLNASVINTV